MQSMTIEQLRAASNTGGVLGVTLKGQGGAFLVQIAIAAAHEFVTDENCKLISYLAEKSRERRVA